MFIVRIQGGLGNQISQYAFSRWLSKRYPEQEVKFDLEWFVEWAHCEFELVEFFKREYQVFTVATRNEVQNVTKFKHYKIFHPKFIQKVQAKTQLVLRDFFGINSIIYQPVESGYPLPEKILKLDTSKDWYFDGTWHSLDYSEILLELCSELIYRDCDSPSFLEWKKEIVNSNSVSLHIRKGDYVDTERDILPQSNYYKNAIDLMKRRLGNKIKIFVFSDDEDFARSYITTLNTNCDYQIVGKTDRPSYTDMTLMSLCKGNICANSTYSYWAACLNMNSNQLFTIPEKYARTRMIWKVPYGITLPLG